MKFPYVDQYISDFECLASKANNALDARPTIELFTRGLAPAILHDVLSTPNVTDGLSVMRIASYHKWKLYSFIL
jgi:hypothetical protein